MICTFESMIHPMECLGMCKSRQRLTVQRRSSQTKTQWKDRWKNPSLFCYYFDFPQVLEEISNQISLTLFHLFSLIVIARIIRSMSMREWKNLKAKNLIHSIQYRLVLDYKWMNYYYLKSWVFFSLSLSTCFISVSETTLNRILNFIEWFTPVVWR